MLIPPSRIVSTPVIGKKYLTLITTLISISKYAWVSLHTRIITKLLTLLYYLYCLPFYMWLLYFLLFCFYKRIRLIHIIPYNSIDTLNKKFLQLITHFVSNHFTQCSVAYKNIQHNSIKIQQLLKKLCWFMYCILSMTYRNK